MRVWIDADACPRAAKDLVVKFALKRQFEVVLVAGQPQTKPGLAIVKLIVVPSGPDAADDYLVEHAVPGELVICSDIPLADRLVKKGVAALDPRGKEFDAQNMGERLAVRNLFTDLREQGQMSGGPAPFGEREKQAFANALDRILTRLTRKDRVLHNRCGSEPAREGVVSNRFELNDTPLSRAGSLPQSGLQAGRDQTSFS